MLLKQAQAVFLDRIRLALDGSDLCQHPPLYPSTSRNAYMLTATPCTMLLPGILVAPFVSDRYNEESLYGRIGFVVAHEVAHVTSRPSLWDNTTAALLLENYSVSVWQEAAADLTAADALVSTGRITSGEVCQHVSQLWCARTTREYEQTPPNSHPHANIRGNRICKFLRS